jgi:hypothetical protein
VFVHVELRYALQFVVEYWLLADHDLLAIAMVHFSIVEFEI